MTIEPKRGRGRPKGSRNKRPEHAGGGVAVEATALGTGVPDTATELAPARMPGTQRAILEADRERLLQSIKDAAGQPCVTCQRGGDAKVEAALQSQLNGVNRMLLRITGETAPSDANLVRSPQWSRIKAKLFDCLSKKHPAAWADLLRIEAEG